MSEPETAATRLATADEAAPAQEQEAEDTLRFDDPYWDDAFCAWWDPTLRTCC